MKTDWRCFSYDGYWKTRQLNHCVDFYSNLVSLASHREDLSRRFFPEMFWIRIPVFIVSFIHLDQRLSPQGSDLPKPFPRSILAHSATVPSYNIIIASIKLINPSYFTVVCPLPVWLCYYCNVSCVCYPMALTHLCYIVFYCVLSLYFTYWCIDLFRSKAVRVFNKLTYLVANCTTVHYT